MQVGPRVANAHVRMVIKICKDFQSIDLHLVLWPTGGLDMEYMWQWLGMDITHYDDKLHSIHNLAIPSVEGYGLCGEPDKTNFLWTRSHGRITFLQLTIQETNQPLVIWSHISYIYGDGFRNVYIIKCLTYTEGNSSY